MMAVILKTSDEIQKMRDSARVNVEVLLAVREAICPGVTTAELDNIAAAVLDKHGAKAAFLGYPPGGKHPFPATITVSINEELVHGIPGRRVLQEGDIVSIDCGTVYEGFVSDSAFTVPVGEIGPELRQLLEVTEVSLYKGIEVCIPGSHIGDISNAIQFYVESHGFNVVREYGGHGVGRSMHESPHILNYGNPGQGYLLRPGVTLALEPMVMSGKPPTRVLDDHWTVVAADGKPCAHFEHTVAITENGPEILTKMD